MSKGIVKSVTQFNQIKWKTVSVVKIHIAMISAAFLSVPNFCVGLRV